MQIEASNPELAEALKNEDRKKLEEHVEKKMELEFKKTREEQERKARLMNADPNDEEA